MSPVLLVGYLLLFLGAAVAVVLGGLLIGRLLRPNNPTPVKGDIYECGEPSLGTADVQFDLRFYVVALVFLIFDVEVAFFFPWATVFGKAAQLSDPRLPADAQAVRLEELGLGRALESSPGGRPGGASAPTDARGKAATVATDGPPGPVPVRSTAFQSAGPIHGTARPGRKADSLSSAGDVPAFGRRLARLAMLDIAVFFGILMVGFAYVWYRGDLNWIRTPPQGGGGD